MIYLDSAATSFIKPISVSQAMLNAMRTMSSPGRGAYAQAMHAAEMIYDCRCKVAKFFNVDEPENVVFTSSASHSLNIAINSTVKPGQKVLVSGFEHNSVTRPLTAKGAEIIVAGTKLFDDEVVLNDFEKKIKQADIVVCTHVSNVFGYVLPIYKIAELCRKHGKILIVDASQSAGIIHLDCKKLDAAFVAMPGHKALFGPQGTGILICNHRCTPLIHGGSGSDSKLQSMPGYLPDRLEAGTHNVPGIAGLRAGIEFLEQKGVENVYKHEISLLNLMLEELTMSDFELFHGSPQLGVISVRHPQIDSEDLAAALAENNICIRAGMHCAPLAHKSAGTIDTGTARFSFSPFNSEEEIIKTCRFLKSF